VYAGIASVLGVDGTDEWELRAIGDEPSAAKTNAVIRTARAADVDGWLNTVRRKA